MIHETTNDSTPSQHASSKLPLALAGVAVVTALILVLFLGKHDTTTQAPSVQTTNTPSSLSVTSAGGAIGQAAGAAVPAPSSSMSPTGNPQEVGGSGLGATQAPSGGQLIIK